MVHLYFLAAPRLRSECRYASGGVCFVKPLLPLGVALACMALFAVQICTADDGAGAEGFCVGEGHGSSPTSSAGTSTVSPSFSETMARMAATKRVGPSPFAHKQKVFPS